MSRKTLAIAAIVVALVGTFVLVYGGDIVRDWKIDGAITDIKMGRRINEARERLLNSGDRAAALDALKDALNDENDSVEAKINLLATLGPAYFNEVRVIGRALDSGVKSTHRAAAWTLWTDPALADRCGEIALDWVRDAGADSRSKAVLKVRRLKMERAVPTLLAFLDDVPEDQEGLDTLRQALQALKDFKPKGLGEKLLGIAQNTALQESVRADALDALSTLDDAPIAAIQEMALEAVRDRKNTVVLRAKMAGMLRREAFANEQVWSVLEGVLHLKCLW
jgi:hypothetical protein